MQSDSGDLTPGLVLVRSHRIFETRLEGLPTWDEGPTSSITGRVTIPKEPVFLYPNTMTDEEPDRRSYLSAKTTDRDLAAHSVNGADMFSIYISVR